MLLNSNMFQDEQGSCCKLYVTGMDFYKPIWMFIAQEVSFLNDSVVNRLISACLNYQGTAP